MKLTAYSKIPLFYHKYILIITYFYFYVNFFGVRVRFVFVNLTTLVRK